MERIFENRYGYFSSDGSEYVIKTPELPKPWINVVSNGKYGIVISQAGGGFSWYEHSELNRITRWHQDLVRDNWGKYFIVKDNDTGDIWSPTWMPIRRRLDFYQCRHGVGYTVFRAGFKGLFIELTVFVPFNKNVEVWYFKFLNESGEVKNVSLYSYLEWCLGVSADLHREFYKCFIRTEFLREMNALIATKRLWEIDHTNGRWNSDYPFIAYHGCSEEVDSFECDKESFLGNYGSLSAPKEIMRGGKLGGHCGDGYDPIASLCKNIRIDPGKERKISFFIGIEGKLEGVREALKYFADSKVVEKELEETKNRWNKLLNGSEVKTPDMAIDILVNRWLKYQTISSRIWGRCAYYQQSGAYGYRDQLQDSMIFLHLAPELCKNQIVLHAKHQLSTGRALQWWHSITEVGEKVNMSDTHLWLPFVVYKYVLETGDSGFLDEMIPYYDKPDMVESIYEHCCRAIDITLSDTDKDGLPFIQSGDWNDGMSAVGVNSKGISIWVGEFLVYILDGFLEICKMKGDRGREKRYSEAVNMLKDKINHLYWDGEWYIRAVKDNGEKIGSKGSQYGKIFLNPQSWAIISEIADNEKKEIIFRSVEKYLLKEYGPLLLAPAYKEVDGNIGYLSRYAPGVRENGGVYTHAAVWFIWALCKAKKRNLSYRVLESINPILNGMNPDRYKCEPYVTPGNIEGPESPFPGKGAWTWYTGSAQWLYSVIMEWVIGVRPAKEGLLIDPNLPDKWDKVKVKRYFRGSLYDIIITNNSKDGVVKYIEVEGKIIEGKIIPLATDSLVKVKVVI